MGSRSRRKGAVGEREFAKVLQAWGVEARRGVQFSGSPMSPDVEHGIFGVHFEVKRTEALRLYDAMAQAIGDCGNAVPVVATRRNRSEWLLVLRADDLPELVRRVYKVVGGEEEESFDSF